MDMHPPPKGLDALDLFLVAALIANARITNRELARLSGVAEQTCIQRRRRLEKQGIILGYTAIVAFEQLPATFRAWFSVRLAKQSAGAAKQLEGLIAQEPSIVSTFATGGSMDYFFETRTHDYAAARELKARLEEREDIVSEIQMCPVLWQLRSRPEPSFCDISRDE